MTIRNHSQISVLSSLTQLCLYQTQLDSRRNLPTLHGRHADRTQEERLDVAERRTGTEVRRRSQTRRQRKRDSGAQVRENVWYYDYKR
jgi:hypothetical protein